MRWPSPKSNPDVKTETVKWPTVDYAAELALSVSKGRKKKKRKTDADGDHDGSTDANEVG